MAIEARHIALAIAGAALTGVVLTEGPGKSATGQPADCTASAAPASQAQQPAGAPLAADARAVPAASGTLPADLRSAPKAILTVSGSNFGAGQVAACPAATPAATKAHKTRSKIQNN